MEYNLKNCNSVNRKPLTYEIDTETGCWECGSHYINKGGYPKCTYGGISTSVHRAVFISHFNITNIPSCLLIRHTCDNKLCINPNHLLVGTNMDNIQDMVNRNRQAKGVKNGQSKLTEKEVLLIRHSTDSSRKLGKKYNISSNMVCFIKNRKKWSWL